MRPEDHLLLNCLRNEPLSGSRCGKVDWDRLLHTALVHGVSALLYVRLRGADGVPAGILEKLRGQAFVTVVRNLTMPRELVAVMEGFQARGIQALSFKGPALAARLYGAQPLREFSDLDILVHKRDLEKADASLQALGYQRSGSGFETGNHTRMMVRKQTGAVVDLHWGLMHERVVREGDWRQVWDRLSSVTVEGTEVPTLADEDLLYYLCIHGSKHNWSSLAWLCDVAQLLRVQPKIDWGVVTGRARRSGTRRMLLVGLLLAHGLLEAPVPARMLEEAAKDGAVRRLTAQLRDGMFEEDRQVGPFGLALFRLRVSERWRDRAWHVLMIAASPASLLHGIRWLSARGQARP